MNRDEMISKIKYSSNPFNKVQQLLLLLVLDQPLKSYRPSMPQRANSKPVWYWPEDRSKPHSGQIFPVSSFLEFLDAPYCTNYPPKQLYTLHIGAHH